MSDVTHEALARRVETEEPTEELRDAVALATGWVTHGVFWSWGGGAWKSPSGALSARPSDPLHRRDDAAEMMPDGWRVTISEFNGAGWTATAYRETDRLSVYAEAPTEQRARTAAAIRARGMGSE